MKVTIREVARRADVGIATVSRVLNDDPEVAQATRERVQSACADLGYVRSSVGRSLKTGSTDNVGVAIMARHAPVILNPFYAEVIGGVEEVLEANDKHLLLSSLKRPQDLLDLAREGRVDGLLVVGCDVDDEHLERLVHAGRPVVLIDHAFPGLPAVTIDHHQGAVLAAEHLIACGCTRFAFIAENLDNPNFLQRLEGFRETLAAHGIVLAPAAIAAGGDSWEGGYHAMRKVLSANDPVPDGVFAANDPAALSACRALRQAGFAVPGQVRVVGFDDLQLSALAEPALTTVRVRKRELGRVGARHLLALMNGAEVPPSTALATRLVVRESTGGAGGGS